MTLAIFRYIFSGIKYWLLLILITCYTGCKERPEPVNSTYTFVEPDYHLVKIQATTDTLTLALHNETYNAAESFNTFVEKGTEYLSFYDDLSKTINVYDIRSQELIKRMQLKDWFSKNKLYKTTVFVRNFDSIFITNRTKLYLFDSSGTIIKSFNFLKNPPLAWANFDNTHPAILKNKMLFVGIRPYVKDNSIEALERWKVIYGFNVENRDTKLFYNLPEVYRNRYYGYHFLDCNYCYNSNGNFVLSFPADTNIYESNLSDYQASYFGKSQFQSSVILPVRRDLLKTEGYKQFSIRDSYGAIYFDSYASRYLRVAKSKVSEVEYENKKRRKKQRLIVFNEQFKIIGETEIDNEIYLDTIFFTRDGKIYARTKVRDEGALYFVRLLYSDDKSVEQAQLVKK